MEKMRSEQPKMTITTIKDKEKEDGIESYRALPFCYKDGWN
jgi:hypothetical protein